MQLYGNELNNISLLENKQRHTQNAVIHVGPHKTGTTSIQGASRTFRKWIKQDKYETPDRSDETVNFVSFAACFLQDDMGFSSTHTCDDDFLARGVELGEEGKNLLISSESFSFPKLNVLVLADYLKPWDVTIVVYHRRYYDYLYSMYNQMNTIKHYGDNIMKMQRDTKSLYDTFSDSKWRANYENTHTYKEVSRFNEHFDNIKVMNYHDKEKDLLEGFYCDAMPDANNVCQIIKAKGPQMDVLKQNKSSSLTYNSIIFAAYREKVIDIQTNDEAALALQRVQDYQEKTLGLTGDDFVKKCLPQEVLDEILETSLKYEKELLPDFYASPSGEAALRLDFEKKSQNAFCSVDTDVIFESSEWMDFFKSLQTELETELETSRT